MKCGHQLDNKYATLKAYRLIPQKYNESNNNMGYGGKCLWIVCVVLWWEVGERGIALNRLNNTREIFEVMLPIG